MPKQRTHNEWFRPISIGNRKSCPNCKEKLEPSEHIWSWGNYICAKWHTVKYFCKACFPEIQKQLLDHKGPCGCEINLVGYHTTLPSWLTLEKPNEIPINCVHAG